MNNNRILRKKELLHLTGLSNATIHRLIAKGDFPVGKKLTGIGGRAVGWEEQDVLDWIKGRADAH